jgi:hypothetical protein
MNFQKNLRRKKRPSYSHSGSLSGTRKANYASKITSKKEPLAAIGRGRFHPYFGKQGDI